MLPLSVRHVSAIARPVKGCGYLVANVTIDGLEAASGDEFRHRSSDDDADHRRTVRGHRCPDPVRRFRRGSRPDLDITIGEHLEVVIRSSAEIPSTVA
jgi:hypothetical protein